MLISLDDTVVLVAVCTSYKPRAGMDFFPLTVNLEEKSYAAGKIPGGFFKREGRPTTEATLNSRLIDRPIRPLFPEGFMNEVQVTGTVLSSDPEIDPGLVGLIGTSAALTISDIPWNGPVAGCTVGRFNGDWVANPSYQQLGESECELLLAAREDGIVMVEGALNELTEAEVLEGLRFGAEAMKPVFELIERVRQKAGKEKHPWTPAEPDTEFINKVRAVAKPLVQEAAFIPTKAERYGAIAAAKKTTIAELGEEGQSRSGEIGGIVSDLKSEIVRERILAEGSRIDGRGLSDVREIATEVDVLPRTHGSSLFTRGETQALATVTFGTKRDEQRVDALLGEYKKRFLLHYNFPAFSVGECKMPRGPSRREIGHGTLARRGVLPIVPGEDDFPYTIRVVSEVLESNGSSSMATVCATSLALMQAGVPTKSAVAGIAMGLITDGERTAVLSDILGDEDHLGDMDFKVVGTREGVTALQMDIKIESLSWEVLEGALSQAREGRLHILDEMDKTITGPSDDLSDYAPRIFTVIINPDRIRDLIGPGGKHIRGIVDETGVEIDVDDSGHVNVAAVDGAAAAKAIELIRGYTEEPEVGEVYLGKVVKTVDFGAFIAISPGTVGLCHISELAHERVRATEDVVNEGDEVLVRVIAIDRQGKIKLSRRAALDEQPEEGGDE